MPIYTRSISPSSIHLTPYFHETLNSVPFVPSNGFSLSCSRSLKCSAERFFNEESKRFWRSKWRKVNFSTTVRQKNGVSSLNGVPHTCLRRKNSQKMFCSTSEGQNTGTDSDSSGFMRKRNVVEHLFLLKTKGDISDEDEKDMLDYLYTLQYQMGGIVSISLGRISDQNAEGYTHVVYTRFQRKEDLAKFYENPFYLGVLKDHVMPYCHGLISVDYKSEVEDDILSIFRKGEEFNYGVEFVLLISVVESALGGPAEDALASLANMTREFPSLIVQSTQGLNFNISSKEYTHGVVARFRSLEAFEIFVGCSEYKDLWSSKFQPIIQKSVALHFSVDPVGTEIM